ncbi:MAG: Cu(I)-responsive transcriptional regulator [Pseudomonadota bacterium]
MNISDVAQRSGLPPKTIRYYEDIGLVTPPRGANGYRQFTEVHVHKLAFLGRARAFGFSIEDCRTLLGLYEDESRTSAEVKELAQTHLAEIEGKISALAEMRDTLRTLVHSCAGDDRPDCPILATLAASDS